MRWDSPFVLAAAGTLAIHLIALTAGDALVVTHPPHPTIAPPHIELVEVEVPPVLQPPPPPPPPAAAVPPPPVAEDRPVPRPQVARAVAAPVRPAPEPPPARTDLPVAPGGDQVVHLDDIAPAATGVAVAPGKPVTGHIGRGGAGGGTGSGSGAGTGDEPPRPVSVATIKSRAMPRGDYGYLDAAKDYPPEARTLGIEGVIRVRLVVDEHGKVKSRILLSRLGHGLDELAMQRAAEIEFEPAKDTDDRPVASVVVWTFNMTLPK